VTQNGLPAGTLPVVPGSTMGIVANPMSGRDIRRLVAQASVFPNAEKTNMALRLIAAAGATGVETVLMSTDGMGVAGGVVRARDRRRAGAPRWPSVEFVELDALTGTAHDTRSLVTAMRERGAGVIVLLGGDGTVRAASATSGDVALLPLSTGTNNAFPEMWEATVAGTAAGLLATGRADPDATYRAKVLRVAAGSVEEIALVDVCVSTVAHVGSKALWQPDTLREVYCAFAEPHAIGLSSIAGLLHPTGRTDPDGVAVRLAPPLHAPQTVLAPIAPGVVVPIGIRDAVPLRVGERRTVAVERGTVAVDGEREVEFSPATPVTVTLAHDGPRVLDVRRVLAAAARERLLVSQIQEVT
jgi:predicted polyphosphate/ATP-dependent NAD kinase